MIILNVTVYMNKSLILYHLPVSVITRTTIDLVCVFSDKTVNAYRLKLIQMCIVTGLLISNGRHADNLAKDFTYCGANRCCVIDFCIEYPKHFQFNTSDLGPLHIKLRMGYTINITLNQPEGTSCNRHDHIRYRWKEDLVI